MQPQFKVKMISKCLQSVLCWQKCSSKSLQYIEKEFVLRKRKKSMEELKSMHLFYSVRYFTLLVLEQSISWLINQSQNVRGFFLLDQLNIKHFIKEINETVGIKCLIECFLVGVNSQMKCQGIKSFNNKELFGSHATTLKII